MIKPSENSPTSAESSPPAGVLSPLTRLLRLLVQVALLLVLYGLCRLLFIVVHKNAWQPSVSWVLLLVKGVRFDLSAIAMTNALFVVLSLLPFPFVARRGWQKLLRVIFISFNAVALLANLVDVAYFPFIHKRSQFDALRFITGEKGNDFYTLLPAFLLQYWYLVLVFAALLFLLAKGYTLSLRLKSKPENSRLRAFLLNTLLFLAGAGLTVVAMRGGLQLIPIGVANAGEAAGVQQAPAILNTPFSILTTTERKNLPDYRYFDEQTLQRIHPVIHAPLTKDSFRKKNVVVILVESLSSRYVYALGGTIPTPFLDSLLAQSLLFTNGFANAEESVQGIPAVLASIPSWQDEPYTFSAYASNRVTSIANLLTPYGYKTAFFHGGKNGTMGFDVFSKLAGYQRYFGKTEYGNDADYDGHWGIWDEPFLQFTARKLATFPQPFTAAVFTLNTHHPFVLPEKYRTRFAEEGHPIRSCVRYADYALSQFFAEARKMSWYKNAIFVLTADHGSPRLEEGTYSPLDDYRIPIAFFTPDGSIAPRRDSTFANQIDVLPTLMEALHYPASYFSLGSILLHPAPRYPYTLSYRSGVYLATDSLYAYQFDGQKPLALYRWREDAFFSNNVLSQEQEKPAYRALDTAVKGSVQSFVQALRSNTMWLKTPEIHP